MITNFKFDRDSLDPKLKDLATWPSVKTDAWSAKRRSLFERLEGAIRSYFGGGIVKEICQRYNISRQEFYRYLRRCLDTHRDGQIYGWRGIIPYARQKSYQRRKPAKSHQRSTGGNSGAFNQLLDLYPDIAEGIQNRLLKELPEEAVHEPRIPLMAILKWFLNACKRKGLTAKDYPFCTNSLGRTALWKHLKTLMNLHPEKVIKSRYGKHAGRRWRSTGHGPSVEKVTRPFERVQFDGHRLDMNCVVLVPHTHGDLIELALGRLWLLAIVDVYSRTILGYHVSLNAEYNTEDVLQCAKSAIIPWKPRALSIPGLQYAYGGGLPSGVIPKLSWVLFDELCYDNAKANLAERAVNKITSVLGCAINPGPVESPERRGIIERVFALLEEAGFHRFPSTTGSHPQDPRRNHPQAQAERLRITLDHLLEIIDLVIARYNATPHSGIGYKSPLDVMQHFADDDNSLIRTLPEDQRGKLGLLDIEFTKTVRGDLKTGRRPYVDCEGARYRNDLLSRSPELIKTKLTLVMDPEDARLVTAYLPNGAELGVLVANSFWGIRPHTLEIRKAILSLKKKKLIYLTESQDPIPVYLDYLAGSKKGKSAARAHAKAQPFREEPHTPSSALPTTNAEASSLNDENPSVSEPGTTFNY